MVFLSDFISLRGYMMTISKIQENGKITLALVGRFDTTTSPQVQEALIPVFDEFKQVKLDLSQLEYISSAGLRVLLTAKKTATSKGASLTLSGVSEEIMEVFEMTGFSDMLTLL